MANVFAGGNLDSVRAKLLNREDQNRLEDALPHQKASLGARYVLGRFGGLARATYYGAIRYLNPLSSANDERFGAKTLLDLDLSYELLSGVRIAIGGINVFNTYSDPQVKSANISSGRLVYSRRAARLGMNVWWYKVRLHHKLRLTDG